MATAKKTTATRKPAGTAIPKAPAKKPAPARPAATPKPGGKAVSVKKIAAKPAPAPKVEKAAKTEKAKKPKLVRDSFTIPKAEYVVLDDLKQRAARLAHPVKKSELLRAGIKALAAMSDPAFLKAMDNVPAIKTGRPAA
jgi:hypothetical protein